MGFNLFDPSTWGGLSPQAVGGDLGWVVHNSAGVLQAEGQAVVTSLDLLGNQVNPSGTGFVHDALSAPGAAASDIAQSFKPAIKTVGEYPSDLTAGIPQAGANLGAGAGGFLGNLFTGTGGGLGKGLGSALLPIALIGGGLIVVLMIANRHTDTVRPVEVRGV